MKNTNLILCVLICILHMASISYAQLPENDKRFERLASNYRCVVCQGQSVLESDAEIAKEFKMLLIQKIEAGKTDSEIDAFFYERYGDFIFMNPKTRIHQYALWVVPLLCFVIMLFTIVVRRKPLENN